MKMWKKLLTSVLSAVMVFTLLSTGAFAAETNSSLKTPVLSLNIDRFDSSEIGEYLNNKGIYLRTSYHCAPPIHKVIGTEGKGTIRVSPGYFNTFNDIEALINTLINIYNFS